MELHEYDQTDIRPTREELELKLKEFLVDEIPEDDIYFKDIFEYLSERILGYYQQIHSHEHWGQYTEASILYREFSDFLESEEFDEGSEEHYYPLICNVFQAYSQCAMDNTCPEDAGCKEEDF